MHTLLTDDTKVIILLCGILGKDCSVKILSQGEYSSVVRWLVERQLRPEALLNREYISSLAEETKMSFERLQALLDRGVQLGFAVENWNQNGIWIISRSDQDYPQRYKNHLKDKAPPLLFGVGDSSLLKGGGVAIVGSRNVDSEGEAFAMEVGDLCAFNNMPVVSGGARGVDQIAMNAALDANGTVIGVLAQNLLRTSTERNARVAIADGRLLLLSPYHPNARFTVGTAMARNKLLYAMADYGLVVSAEFNNGGTWAGAKEELKRNNPLPVFVRISDAAPSGNTKLLGLGAIEWPSNLKKQKLNKQLEKIASKDHDFKEQQNRTLFDMPKKKPGKQVDILDENIKPVEKVVENVDRKISSTSIYEAVLPVIIAGLSSPTSTDVLAKKFEVSKTQLNLWLKKAVKEHKIEKLSNPVRYCKVQN
ncbi:MAG: DNA-processing protein DprA [Anaerolineae bacterium]|nr:DNA-processing protein DprA [Anaerolineae bacterium]